MIRLLDSLLARSTLVLVAAASLLSCATPPAQVNRVGTGGSGSCPLYDRSLGELLTLSLADPESEESAHALAHFVEEWQKTRGSSDSGEVVAVDVDGSERRYAIRFDGTHGGFPLTYFDRITPAVDYRVKRIEHHRREGFGAPLVALRENRHQEPIEIHYPPEAITRPITAVIRPGSVVDGVTRVDIDLLCPLTTSTATDAEGRTRELAADFSVPWAALLARAGNLKRNEFNEALRRTPDREPRLYLMEPYDPAKEPLIMVHGLFDSPLVWATVSNELWADDEIRSRYQIWHYLYNTNAPALYSGRILRNQLRTIRPLLDPDGGDPAMQSTTLLAHSMGGIVSRSLITRPGDAFWDAAFTLPFEDLKLSDPDRQSLRNAFFWEPETHVKRVIYAAVPHLGSDHAENLTGRIGRFLVKPPNQFQEFYDRISSQNPGAFTPAYQRLGTGRLDSVHALSPEQPTLPILAGLPNSHPVVEHSIIGTRGKSGPLEDSSDGLVDYWSSHLDRVESEFIVPEDHRLVDHPMTIGEIKRILKLP